MNQSAVMHKRWCMSGDYGMIKKRQFMGCYLSLLEPLPAVDFLELLERVGQEGHHAAVQVPSHRDNVGD